MNDNPNVENKSARDQALENARMLALAMNSTNLSTPEVVMETLMIFTMDALISAERGFGHMVSEGAPSLSAQYMNTLMSSLGGSIQCVDTVLSQNIREEKAKAQAEANKKEQN